MTILNKLYRFRFLKTKGAFQLWPIYIKFNDTREYGKFPFIIICLDLSNRFWLVWGFYWPATKWTKGYWIEKYSTDKIRTFIVYYEKCKDCGDWGFYTKTDYYPKYVCTSCIREREKPEWMNDSKKKLGSVKTSGGFSFRTYIE